MSHSIWFFLFFLCYTFPCRHALILTHQRCLHDQMEALLRFKDMFTIGEYNPEFNDPFNDFPKGSQFWCPSGYPKTMSWNNKNGNNSDCCRWDGVTCDKETGHVIELDLSCSQLNGTISSNTSDGLFHLTHLRRLNLAYNNFYGSQISPAFGRFTDLTHLNLSSSSFNGSIPRELSYLSKLVSIDVTDNFELSVEANDFDSLLKNLTHLKELVFGGVSEGVRISSSIPNSLMNLSALEIIDLAFCDLHGILPGQIFMFPHLQVLYLAINNLGGDIPDISSTNTSSLQILGMASNELFGNRGLPDSIGNLTSLRYLGLSDTGLAGELPHSIGNLTSLSYLDLSNTSLAGELPASLEKLRSLRYLDLHSTGLAGELPDSIGCLKSLTYLRFSYCNLSGSIPNSIGNLTELTQLGLTDNNLSGSIPKSIGNLTQLTQLGLSFNSFHSQVPITISNLKKLEWLSLSNNRLNGTLPPWLFTIPTLSTLKLGFNQLTGPIPDFQNESSLVNINLSNNNLQGSIPHSIVNLVNLTELNLSSNKFNGTIKPLLFSKFQHLKRLDLSRNFLQGSFPILPMSLETFVISHNRFSGLLPVLHVSLVVLVTSHNQLSGDIPSSICNLTNLNMLDVSNNSLGGEIPQCLANNYVLMVLDLQKNRFSGTIPPIYAFMLRTLNLNDNYFEGPIPESLSNCKELELLDLGKNKLNGSFPQWLETFSELQVLVLRSNKFQGHVGTSKTISTYPKLRIFDLSDNEFTGLLPARYFQNFIAMKNSKETEGGPKYMESGDSYYQSSIAVVWNGVELKFERILTTLVTIDLSANNFEGQIPEALQELNSLRMLNLSHNSLTGSIPASLGNLSNLQYLDLSSNILTGTIPIQLARITTLANLNVSYNHLVGPIPQGRQFDTFENSSYIENSGLCGFPLSDLCGDYKKPQSPKMTKQKEDHSIFSRRFTWEIVLFGYGCGVPFGLILGFLMFFVGWPRWFLGIAGRQNGRPRRRRNHA